MTRSWSSRERRALGAALVLLAVLLAGCSPGTTPPSVCVVCDERTVDAAAERGANVTVTDSEVHVHIRADGSARWVVRVGLSGEGVEAFRSNESLRRAVIEERFRRNDGPAPDQPENITSRMEVETLVVAFGDAGFASSRPGGVLLVERFHHQTDPAVQAPFRLAADRLVVHAPDGWQVLNDVPEAEERRRTVVWRDQVDDRTYVLLGPDASTKREAAGEAAVAGAVAGWATLPVLGASILPIVLVGGFLAFAVSRVDRPAPSHSVDPRDPELQGSMVLTGLVVLAAVVAIARWHVPASGVIGDVLSAVSWSDPGISVAGVVLFVVLIVAPMVGGAFVAGAVAHRRPAIRWPPVALALAAVPLEGLWMVFVGAYAAVVAGLLLAAVGLVAALPTFGAFELGRRTARELGWAPVADEEDGRARRGDEHAGE